MGETLSETTLAKFTTTTGADVRITAWQGGMVLFGIADQVFAFAPEDARQLAERLLEMTHDVAPVRPSTIKRVKVFLRRASDTPTEDDETFNKGERRDVLALCNALPDGLPVEVRDCYGEPLYEAQGGDEDL